MNILRLNHQTQDKALVVLFRGRTIRLKFHVSGVCFIGKWQGDDETYMGNFDFSFPGKLAIAIRYAMFDNPKDMTAIRSIQNACMRSSRSAEESIIAKSTPQEVQRTTRKRVDTPDDALL